MKNKVKVQRAIHNLSQQQVADAVHVSRQTINAIETQRYYPSNVLSMRIAYFFKVPVEEIFSLEEDEKNDIIQVPD